MFASFVVFMMFESSFFTRVFTNMLFRVSVLARAVSYSIESSSLGRTGVRGDGGMGRCLSLFVFFHCFLGRSGVVVLFALVFFCSFPFLVS